MLYASLRSINVFTCLCTDCIKSYVLGKLLFIVILLKSSWSFVCQDEAHKQSLVNWLLIATLSGKSWRLIGCSATLAHTRPDCEFRAPPRSAAWNSLLIVELPDVFLSISIWMKMNFLFTWSRAGSSFWWLFQKIADTCFHAWNRFQLDRLVEVLRDSPCRHSHRWCFSQSVLSNELAFSSREYMWCESWCSPIVLGVSICLLWMILLY